MQRLAGKVAIVVGASDGIGRTTSIRLAESGARVVVASRREAAGLDVVETIAKGGGEAIFVQTDATDEQSVQQLAARTLERFGRIDVLYNNVGGSTAQDGNVLTATNDEFWRSIKFNVFSAWICCRSVIPHMIESGGGSIINAGSAVAMTGIGRLSAYSAAKGALVSLTRSMAAEYAVHKIRVNAVVPGIVTTDRMKARLENNPATAAAAAKYPLGVASPADVADAVIFLASDESRRTTGHMFPVDGGILSTSI